MKIEKANKGFIDNDLFHEQIDILYGEDGSIEQSAFLEFFHKVLAKLGIAC